MKRNSSLSLLFRSILLIGMCASTILVTAQNIAINIDGTPADATAILDVKSTTQGLLIPRMTTAERNAIVSPAEGLLVFDITTQGFQYYTGGAWNNLSSGWSLNGNTGTNPANHFIGTRDNQPLKFRVNNFPAGGIDHNNFNVSLGQVSLFLNTTGQHNIAIGHG